MVRGEPLAGLFGHFGLVLALANHLQQEENTGETPGIEGLFKNTASQCYLDGFAVLAGDVHPDVGPGHRNLVLGEGHGSQKVPKSDNFKGELSKSKSKIKSKKKCKKKNKSKRKSKGRRSLTKSGGGSGGGRLNEVDLQGVTDPYLSGLDLCLALGVVVDVDKVRADGGGILPQPWWRGTWQTR